MKKNMNQPSTDSQERFTKVSHIVLERLLTARLNKREYILALLVIRLTSGCHKDWAELIQADLSAVGISPNHAKEVIASSIEKGLLVQNNKTKQYKLGSLNQLPIAGDIEKLKKLVGKQLNASHNGNIGVPEMGTKELPNQEYASSRNGNIRPFLEGELIRSDNAPANERKDNDKDNFIESSKYNNPSKRFIDPHDFKAKDDKERAALATWNALEPDKPNSFGLYLSLAHKGLSAEMFYSLATEIKDDPTVTNKGAAFAKRTFDFRRWVLIRGKAANV